MINAEFLQQILARKKTNRIELKEAPFFEIEKDGRVAYVLGADHSYDLSTLPGFVLTHIQQADQLFTEHAIPSEKEFYDFLETVKIKATDDFRWNNILSDKQLESFTCMAREALLAINIEIKDVLELEPAFLMNFINQHIESMIETTQVNAGSEESEIETNIPMDAELMDLFGENTMSLEPDYSSVRVEEFDDEMIEKLKEKLLPFYEGHKNFAILTAPEREAFFKLRAELISKVHEEKSSYEINFMKDFSHKTDLDNELENGDFKMVSSNLVMFNTIDKSIANHRKPLYVMGADHLIGSLGLLNILRLKGYRISKVTPENSAQPIQYLYNQYLASYQRIRQDILKKPAANPVQSLLLKNPLQPIEVECLGLQNILFPSEKPRLLLK